jgi:hypothetical protein
MKSDFKMPGEIGDAGREFHRVKTELKGITMQVFRTPAFALSRLCLRVDSVDVSPPLISLEE